MECGLTQLVGTGNSECVMLPDSACGAFAPKDERRDIYVMRMIYAIYYCAKIYGNMYDKVVIAVPDGKDGNYQLFSDMMNHRDV